VQFCAVVRVPSWGVNNPFPFTALRSIEMPLVLGASAAIFLFSKRSAAMRTPTYSIVAVCAAQIVTVEVMLWLGEPSLILLVMALNAFLAAQFLIFGYDYLFARRTDRVAE